MSAATIARHALYTASRKLFRGADRLGFHILPKHYYTPIADHTWLNQNRSAWCRRVDMSGVHWDLQEQLAWLSRQCSPYYEEVRRLDVYREATAKGFGPGYGPIESQVLHCVCRSLKPRRLIEVGSGTSTVCALHALERNRAESGIASAITCVEPFPHEALRQLQGIHLVQSMVQTLPLNFFDQLGDGDILFIDSSHSVKTGSDVLFLCLEVLPRLKPGVVVHIHDIFLPYLYQLDVLDSYFDWQETALVLALLKHNARLETLACLSALHYDATSEMRSILWDYQPEPTSPDGLCTTRTAHFPASLWLRVKPDNS